MKVKIPLTPNHGGFDWNVGEVEISDYCPKCGKRRGKPFQAVSFDGSRSVACDGWRNPCGHIDYYEDVVQEAKKLRRNK